MKKIALTDRARMRIKNKARAIIGYFALPENMSFEHEQRQRPGPTGAVVWMAGVVLHCLIALTMVLLTLAYVGLGLSVIAQVVWWLLTGERLLLF